MNDKLTLLTLFQIDPLSKITRIIGKRDKYQLSGTFPKLEKYLNSQQNKLHLPKTAKLLYLTILNTRFVLLLDFKDDSNMSIDVYYSNDDEIKYRILWNIRTDSYDTYNMANNVAELQNTSNFMHHTGIPINYDTFPKTLSKIIFEKVRLFIYILNELDENKALDIVETNDVNTIDLEKLQQKITVVQPYRNHNNKRVKAHIRRHIK